MPQHTPNRKHHYGIRIFLQLNSTAIEDDEEDYKDKGKENEGEGPLDRGFPLIPLK